MGWVGGWLGRWMYAGEGGMWVVGVYAEMLLHVSGFSYAVPLSSALDVMVCMTIRTRQVVSVTINVTLTTVSSSGDTSQLW